MDRKTIGDKFLHDLTSRGFIKDRERSHDLAQSYTKGEYSVKRLMFGFSFIYVTKNNKDLTETVDLGDLYKIENPFDLDEDELLLYYALLDTEKADDIIKYLTTLNKIIKGEMNVQ